MSLFVKEILGRRISFSIAFVMVGIALGARGLENNPAKPAGFSAFVSAPLYFEGNAGQSDSGAQFIARGTECSVLLAPTEAEIVLGKSPGQTMAPGGNAPRAVRLQLIGANPASKITGRDQMPGKANYFIGSEPSKWHTGIPLFSKVQVNDVYPGVQVVYYANQSAQLEYDFLLQPGVQAGQIRFRISGADNVRVDDAGNLALKIGSDEIRQHKPVAYQEKGGARTEIQASYHLNIDGTIGFTLGQYDHGVPLVIDPVLDFLTYIGGKKVEIGWAIAVDGGGNIYVAGETLSTDLPTTNTIQYGATNFSKFRGGNNAFGDAFVAKYNNTGALDFLTYLGGKTDDGAMGIAYDPNGNGGIWITGFTDSTNFPLQNPLATNLKLTGPVKNAKRIFPVDAFIAKLDTNGSSLLFSTFFGGNNIDEGVGITLDFIGNVYVTGLTASTNLPVTPTNAFQTKVKGDFDAFITKLSGADGVYSNAYTTYLGGTNTDYGLSIAVDAGQNAWVTGVTYSTNFYTTNAIQLGAGVDAFFPAGHTFTDLNTQTNFPKHTVAFRSDAFITEVSSDGTSVPFSTYLGGTNDEVGEHITLDAAGNVYVAGYTLSQDFPTNVITVQTTNTYGFTNVVFPTVATNFAAHAFVTELTNRMLAYSTHFGGNFADEATSIGVAANGLIYVTGSVGSTNFFATNMIVLTNDAPPVIVRHQLVYPGFSTNNPIFTNLSNTNITTKLKRSSGNTNDIFIAVLSPGLSNFVQSVLLGGPGEDEVNGMVVDSSGQAVYIVGTTTSRTNFTTTNAVQRIYGGGKSGRLSDAFMGRVQITPSP